MDTNTFLCIVLIVSLLVAISIKIYGLEKFINSWRAHCLHHDKLFDDVEWHRADDLGKLAALEQRVRTLEEQLEAQAAELTEHHNKIDTLEINGTIYESLFEQQGLWGESKE